MHQQHSSKDDARPDWYAELANPPFRSFDELFANRLLSRVNVRPQGAGNAQLKRMLRLTLGVIAATGLFFTGFAISNIWEVRGTLVQSPSTSNTAAQTESWVTHERSGARFDLPADWTVTPLPSQPSIEEAAHIAEEQLKLLQYKSQLLQLMKESTPFGDLQRSEGGIQTLDSVEVEVMKLEVQIAEQERKLAEYQRTTPESRQPTLAFASPDEPEKLGTLRVIDNYGLVSSQSLDTKFPAGATLLEPVHPLIARDVKADDDGGIATPISIARLRYPSSDGGTELVATHYYIMFGTTTYEFAFFGSLVSDDVKERIALSLARAQ